MRILPFRNCTNITAFPKSGITVKFQPSGYSPDALETPLRCLLAKKTTAPWQMILSWRVLFAGIKLNINEENL
jgi:hypothetical protein